MSFDIKFEVYQSKLKQSEFISIIVSKYIQIFEQKPIIHYLYSCQDI